MGKKISEITENVTPLNGSELLEFVQGGVTKKGTAKDIADLSIPLSGTEVGSPVTGDIQFPSLDGELYKIYGIGSGVGEDGLMLGNFLDFNGDGYAVALVRDETEGNGDKQVIVGLNGTSATFKSINKLNGYFYQLLTSTNGQITVASNDPSFRGLTANAYYGANYDNNTYVQKLYVDRLTPKVANNFADDAAAAVGGIEVGQVYHTAGVVKIRLV